MSRADRLWLRPIAARVISIFSGVSTVLTLSPGFLFVAEAVDRNPVLDNVIRNRSMSLGVKMSSEYLLRWYHCRYSLKTSVRRTHGVQPITDRYLLNGVLS
jgi:hypothetical protein